MSFINYGAKEINCKIVYYGAGMSGKTTNIKHIYEKTNPKAKGNMVSLATGDERTLFFDFLPLHVGQIRGFKTRFHLYSVPGQVFYDASRRVILKGVDGIVFVVDSQLDRMDANLESFENLKENLKLVGKSLDDIPVILQYNKRDLPFLASVAQLQSEFNVANKPFFEAVAHRGDGVYESLKTIGKLVLKSLKSSAVS